MSHPPSSFQVSPNLLHYSKAQPCAPNQHRSNPFPLQCEATGGQSTWLSVDKKELGGP